jgi:hypothetical protein
MFYLDDINSQYFQRDTVRASLSVEQIRCQTYALFQRTQTRHRHNSTEKNEHNIISKKRIVTLNLPIQIQSVVRPIFGKQEGSNQG